MTSFRTRTRKLRAQTNFERRERWSRTRLMATTGLGGALAGLALGGGNAWGQVGNNTLPTGGQVVAGSATIGQQGTNTLNINQSTSKAVINWSSFDVGKDATVNFYQPDSGSWTVNRVTAGMAPSQILGAVNANGNIVVINPNGVIFGAGSRVDVNGLIATTSNISDQNFMAGNMTFDQPGNPTGMIVNQGNITVKDAGLVAFVAPGVSNSGTITANLGRVSLASGNKFTVDLYGDKLVSIAVDGGTTARPLDANGNPVDALVTNSGQIIADGGRVQMTAQQASQIVDNAINMSGVVRAQSAYVDKNGDIVLDAGPSGNVTVSGTLDVSGQQAGTKGGSVTVTGKNDVVLTGTAKVDASGKAGGGSVKIGGDYLGGGTTPTAKRTLVATGAQISASAVDSGNGGRIIVWSDEHTVMAGALDARGGALSGNGGFIETSSKGALAVTDSASVDASAVNGQAGEWLLDPLNVTITGSGAPGNVTLVDNFADNAGGAGNSNIRDTTILATLNAGTAVTIQANTDIVMEAGANLVQTAGGANGDLTLQAGRSILLGAGNITTDGGDLTLIANESVANGVVDANRAAGAAAITGTGTINAGTGVVTVTIQAGTDKTNDASGGISLGQITTAAGITITDNGTSTGNTITNTGTWTSTAGISVISLNSDISVANAMSAATGLTLDAGRNARINAAISSTGGTINVQANNDITISTAIAPASGTAAIVLQAGRDINVDANITSRGNFTATANDTTQLGANRADATAGDFTMASGTTISTATNNNNITVNVDTTDNATYTPGNVTLRTLNAGTGNVTVNANTAGTQINVNNTITANHVTLTGRRIDLGANIAQSGSITNAAGVPVVVNVLNNTADLDDSMDLVTAGGSTISVAAGTYARSTGWVIDVDDVIVRGAQWGVDGNTGGRTFASGTETILDMNNSTGAVIQADNVTFDGFSIRMSSGSVGHAIFINDNVTPIASPSILNNIISSPTTYQQYGITNNGSINGISGTTSIVGNRVLNYGATLGADGVFINNADDVVISSLYVAGATGSNRGVIVSNSGNVTLSNVTVAGTGAAGVSIANSTSAAISNLIIPVGTSISGRAVAIAGTPTTISGATIAGTVGGDGIQISGGSAALISNLTIGAVGDDGIVITDVGGSSSITNATITGATTDGIEVRNSSANVLVALQNVTISGAGASGIRVIDSTAGVNTAQITLLSGVTINHGAGIGIYVSGNGAGFSDNSLGNTVFISDTVSNASSQYVALANNAEFGNIINGLSASYDGTIGSAVTDIGIAAQIEAKLFDLDDDPAVGDILGAAFLFVGPAGGLQGIQASLDFLDTVANSPGTVVLQSGTYVSGGGVEELVFNQDGVVMVVAPGATVNLEFDSGVAAGAAITINAADVQIDGSAGTLNIYANANYTHVIHVTGASAGGNLVLTSFNIGNLVTNFTGHAIFLESPGIAGDRTISLISISGAGNAGMGVFIDPTVGDSTISGMTISGMAVGIAVDDHTGSLVVNSNTINTISGHGINISDVQDGTGSGFGAGNVQINDNVIASTGSIQGSAIVAAGIFGNVVIQNNDIGSGAAVGGHGIHVITVTGAASGVTITGDTISDFGAAVANSDGIQVEFVSGTATSVVIDSVIIDGNNNADAQDGISFTDVRAATISNASIANTEYGIFITDLINPVVGSSTTISGTSIANVIEAGVLMIDANAAGTSTLFFGAGNVVDGADAGIVISGAATRIGNPTAVGFNDLVLTSITGDFIRLASNAVFAPGNPTVVRAHDVHFDVNDNGIIDAGERGSDYTVPTTQAELDAIFSGYGAIETRIVHNLDDATLGLVQVLPNAFVLTNTAGGLLAIQTATNALGTVAVGQTGAVFVGAGVWGEPAAADPLATPLTINNAGTGTVLLYGTQAFTPIPASARTPGGANETILDFAVTSALPMNGGVVIARTNTSVSGFSMRLDADQAIGIGIRTGTNPFTNININNNFVLGDFAAGGNIAGGAIGMTTDSGTGRLFSVTVSGNSVANSDGTGIFLDMNQGVGGTRQAVVSNNLIDSVGALGGDGIFINEAVATTVNASVSQNTISNVGGGVFGNGIAVLGISNYVLNSNVIDDVTDAGIAVSGGGSGATSISLNRIGTAVGSTIGGDGIDAQLSAGDLNINDNTIGNAAGVQIGDDGISVVNSASTFLRDNTILGVTGDGVQVTWGQAAAANVTIAGLSIDNVGANGIYILENGSGSITTTFVAGGTSITPTDTNISGVATGAGLLFDGNGTRVGGNVLQNLNFLGPFTGDYITLQNNALFNPTNPTQILASDVGFDFDASGTIDAGERGVDYSTAGVTDYLTQTDRSLWGAAESSITHYIDNQTLGFIRLLDTAIVVADPLAGLSSIQRAINLSAPTVVNLVLTTHTVYVNPGSYGDPSTAQGGLDVLTVPYSLNLLGWNDGSSAVTGGRTAGGVNESILNFAGATVPTRGLLIQGSGVVIDGLDFAFDSNQSFGIRIDDSTVARSNISIVNNFIRGTVTNLAGDAIGNLGTQSVTGVTITGNNIDSIGNLSTYDAVDLVNVTGLILQDNLVGTAAVGTGTVFGHGFNVRNSTYATSVSGNSIYDTGLDGIHLDNSGLAAGGATNFVSVVNNTLDNIGENGISANGFRTIAVVNNTIGSALSGTGDSGVTISNTTETVTVTGNSISNVGSDNAGTTAFGIGVTLTAGTGLAAGANAVSIASNTITDNNALTRGEGIFVGGTANGDVRVISNRISNIDLDNGILVLDSGDNVYVTGNSITLVNEDGIQVRNTGAAVTVGANSIHNAGDDGVAIVTVGLNVDVIDNVIATVGAVTSAGDGILVTNTGTVAGDNNGDVRVLRNTVSRVTGTAVDDADDALTTGDGIRISTVDGDVFVGDGTIGNGNTVSFTSNDGIQIRDVRFTVLVDRNIVTSVGNGITSGDGIQIGFVGNDGTVANGNGNVTVSNNVITGVNGNDGLTLDPDDFTALNTTGHSANDGIRIVQVDGAVLVTANSVANTNDDGIAIHEIQRSVSVTGNSVTTVGLFGGQGDGILVSYTGSATGVAGAAGLGNVVVVGNFVQDVRATAGADADDGNSRGDGIRVGDVDGNATVGNDGNTIIDTADDGIQITGVSGNVGAANNTITNVGIASPTGDGIEINFVGLNYFGIGLANASVSVTNNTITNVQGNGVVDTLSDTLSAGDGIRISRIDGAVLVNLNSINGTNNDGIQLYNINAGSTIVGNRLLDIGAVAPASTPDGIVVENTGALFALSADAGDNGSVTIINNTVTNVSGTNGLDIDTISGGTSLSSGDGIRAGAIDGDVEIGQSSVTGNTVGSVVGDGIQVFRATGNGAAAHGVLISHNSVSLAGVGGAGDSDGIVVSNTGQFAGSGVNFSGGVIVRNNTVNRVLGSNIDRDDSITAGDGIRVANADGTVQVLNNIVASTDNVSNDGVQVRNVSQSVTVDNNTIGTTGGAIIGATTNDGDGIVVESTGTLSSAAHAVAGAGAVTVTNNSVSGVINAGIAGLDRDAAVESVAGLNATLTAGDGIRAAYIDGDVRIGDALGNGNGNVIQSVVGDGIQVFAVTGNGGTAGGPGVFISDNTLHTIGFGAGQDGDGIVVSFTGGFVTNPGTTVVNFNGGVDILDNRVDLVLGTGADRDDGRTAGDGIRVRSADGEVEISRNIIASLGLIANDGIQVWDVTQSVSVNSNTVGSVTFQIGGGGANAGDGIVVENTGLFSSKGGNATLTGLGDVVVIANSVTNVQGSGIDDSDGAINPVAGLDTFLTAGDGIRVGFADGTVSVDSNNVLQVGDDGIQVFAVTGNGGSVGTPAVVVTLNSVSVAGGISNAGDGIVVSFTGAFVTNPTGTVTTGLGSVAITNNTVNFIRGTAIDDDDDRTAGDGIRVRSADGTVLVDANNIANFSLGHIDNDGIQIWDVTRSVTVSSNAIGSANASIGVATPNGDGIVVENTGFYSSFGGSGSIGDPSLTFGGSVVVSSNNVRNVVGPAAVETNDGYNPASGAGASLPTIGAENNPNDFLSSGDGIRVAYIDGKANIESNQVTNTAGDGIQAYYISGSNVNGLDFAVLVTNNNVTSVGNGAGGDGDGIVVSFTGGYGLGLAPTVGTNTNDGGVVIQGNTVNGVNGTGADRDDGRTAGDGIRVRSADGFVQILNNTIANSGTIANDGIQVWDVTRNVSVVGNRVGSAGFAVGTVGPNGDGIVIENTGTVTTGGAFYSAAGAGVVVVRNNVIQNVLGTAPDDADGAITAVGATEQFASAGDGIRVAFADGDVLIDNNNILSVGDDGIQVLSVTGNGPNGNTTTLAGVTISNNVVTSVGNGSGLGDGIVVSYTGRADASVGSAVGSGGVLVLNNVVNVVPGNGTDNDDGFTAGDGVRVVRVDGHVTVQGNTIAAASGTAAAGNVANDGIQISHVGRTVRVLNNIVGSVGASIGTGASGDGDGIVVENTGTIASTIYGVAQGGATTVQGNTVRNVFGGAAPNDIDSGYSAGDGIRAANIDGPLVITVNTVTNVGDDGIQADNIAGSVTVTNNILSSIGNVGPQDGDGIVISDVGLMFAGAGPAGVTVIVDNNSITDVAGDGLADPDDANHSNGDGIRVVRVDGSVQTNANSIERTADDGIYIGAVKGTVNVRNNWLNSLGNNSATGDGIVVAVTGSLVGGTAGAGDVTILNNTIANVNANAPGTPDFDNPFNIFAGTNAGFSAGDGIRSENIDGDLVIGDSSTTGNSILNTDDDGIQVDTVRGSVTVLFNTIQNVGLGSNKGDGIAIADVGNAFAGGGPAGVNVVVNSNSILNVGGDGLADPDDAQHSAGDGIRIVRVDGSVQTNINSIQNTDDDGIYVGVVRGSVQVLNNWLLNMGNDSATGDGIVVAVTGSLAGGTAGAGDVTILGNSIQNVNASNAGGADFDNPLNIFGGTAAGYSAGDGIRSENIDGDLVIGNSSTTGNSILNTDDDGIQVQTVRGNVTALYNTIQNVGSDSDAGDGIVIADVGNLFAGGGPAGVNVVVTNNSILNVNGDGLADPDDADHSNGDGIRVVRADGSVSVNVNSIQNTDDDGIYIGVVTNGVQVLNNRLLNMGLDSATGDGIVVALTGSLAGGVAGAGDVTILNNTVTNVNANAPATPDFDDPDGFFGGKNLGYSAGDGIRAENIDGDLTIGSSSTTGNSILNTDDDGIQVDTVRGSVTVLHNRIATVGVDGNLGDGIAIADVGNMFAGLGGPAGVSVIVDNNTITGVNGNGLADPDDAQHSNGDGIRVVRVDGSVQTNTNTINSVDDDGIYIGAVKNTVNVRNNRLTDMGLDSATGDGIVVAVTGSLVTGGAAGAGDVTILNNTVTNVNANAPGSPDFDNPNNFYGATGAGLSSGDGIRANQIDGDLVIGDSSTTGNSILNTDDDGIQVQTVRGNVTALFNRISTVGVGSNAGDGIIVADVGNSFGGGGPSGVTVIVSNNTITGVNGDGLADLNDARHSNGDGIRIVRVDGSVTTATNTIASVDDDGIYVGNILGSVNVLNNRLNSIGLDSATGDGIVVALTGEYAGGAADGGDVTINGNSIANVDAGSPGSPDFDDPNTIHNGTGADLTAGDGIRAEFIDGDVVIGLASATGNSIQTVDDDGIQVFSVTGGTTIGFNTIANVSNDGTSSTSADGIQVNLTGQYATFGYGAVGAGDVVVINNDITNVQNLQVPTLNDPEDLQTAGDGIRLHDISGDATVSNNVIDPIADDGIQMGNIDFTATANNNTILDAGFTSVTGDGILIFNTGIVGLNDGNGNVTVNNNTITNVGIGSGGVGAADPDDGGYGSNDGIRVVTVDGAVSVSGNQITNTRDDGIQIFDIQRSVSVTNNVIATVGVGSSEGDGIVVSSTGTVTDALAPAAGGDVTVSGNSITSVTGNGAADNDDGLTAGDGVRVSSIDGQVVIASNVIQTVGNDGVQAITINDSVSVTGNRISVAGNGSLTGDGISVELVGDSNTDTVVVSQNTIVNVAGDGAANVDNPASGASENDGIRIANTTVSTVTVDANVVTDVGDDGVEVVLITDSGAGTDSVFVTNNTLNSIGTGTDGRGDGILVSRVADGGATVTGNSISNVLSANAGSADTIDGYSAGDAIRVTSIQTNVVVSTNSIGNAADDGIQLGFVAGAVNVLNNRINSVSNVSFTGDGIHINLGAGNTTVSGNIISDVNGNGTADPDVNGMSAGDGIRVDSLTGDLVITNNSITDVGDDGVQVDFNLGNVTVSTNRIDQFGVLSGGSGDGIMVMDTTGSVVANGNVISNGNGVLTDIDDAAFNAGDGMRIVRTSGSVEASNNQVSNVDDDGMQIEITGGTAIANSNSITGAGSDGIEIIDTTGAVTASANVLTNNGTADGGDVGILLIDFASAVVTDNTIVNVSPGSLDIGIDIGNTVGPAVLITMTGNSISDSGTGLFIRDNVMGSVTGNTFTNNVVWGVQIDNGVSGNAIGQGLPGDPVPTLDIWFRDNVLIGNGAPVPGDGVTRGGINNLRPGPAAGGFIFDARGNNFNGQVPFTTGTHFENPNTGGVGDAVSDWVRIDAPAPANAPVIPYYDFGSLLDNLARGGEAKTPGDVLAIGPYFSENGDLFDPYFVDVFATAFGLAGDAAQSAGDANQYAMCTLADMWKVSSCRKAPPK